MTALDVRLESENNLAGGSNKPRKDALSVYSRSNKGKSVQGGTLNLGKTSNPFFLQDPVDPGYLAELMGSLVGQ